MIEKKLASLAEHATSRKTHFVKSNGIAKVIPGTDKRCQIHFQFWSASGMRLFLLLFNKSEEWDSTGTLAEGV